MNMPCFLMCFPAWSVTVFFEQNVHFRQSHWSETGMTGEGEKPLTCFCAPQASWEHSRSDWLWVSWEKERDKRGAERRGSSLASLPDLDRHQTLWISHKRPDTHAWAQTHTHTSYTWTATSHFWERVSLMPQQMNMECEKKRKRKENILSFQLSRYVCTVGPCWLHHWNEIQRMTESAFPSHC